MLVEKQQPIASPREIFQNEEEILIFHVILFPIIKSRISPKYLIFLILLERIIIFNLHL